MTSNGHEAWEELVAGLALDALEPADQAAVTAHLGTCAACRAALGEHRATAAGLVVARPEDAPSPQARARLLAALDGPPAPGLAPAPTTVSPALPAPRRGGWRTRVPMAIAIAAVVVAGLATVVARQQGDAAREQAQRAKRVAACVADPACRGVDLAGDGRRRATALVRGDEVRLVVVDLAANDQTRTYVLWQIQRDGSTVPVGGFDVASGGGVTRAWRLPAAPSGLRALAVTLEPGRRPPARPGSPPVAVGSVG